MARYLAFDIETAKDVPGDDFNWRPHRPLGITCAATLASDRDQPELWYGKNPDGSPAPQMSRQDVGEFLAFMCKAVSEGYRIVSWNGLGFDFDVLAEESGSMEDCKEVALDHIDMMFHLVCCLGYPVSLAKAAQGMGLPGKPPAMSGVKAPVMWAQGQHEEVLKYVAQDVRIAIDVAIAVDARRRFQWITAKGFPKSIPLPRGWLSVRESLLLPEPDTSWMKSRLSRRDFMPWIKGR
jgi:hypothetical protein